MDMEKEFLKAKDLLRFILDNSSDKDDANGPMLLGLNPDHGSGKHDILSIETKEREVNGEKLQVLTFVYDRRDVQESIMDEGLHATCLGAVIAKLARYSDNFLEICDKNFTDRRALRRDTTGLRLEFKHDTATLIISSPTQNEAPAPDSKPSISEKINNWNPPMSFSASELEHMLDEAGIISDTIDENTKVILMNNVDNEHCFRLVTDAYRETDGDMRIICKGHIYNGRAIDEKPLPLTKLLDICNDLSSGRICFDLGDNFTRYPNKQYHTIKVTPAPNVNALLITISRKDDETEKSKVNAAPTDPKLHRTFVKDYNTLTMVAKFLKIMQCDGTLIDDLDIRIDLDTPPEWFETIDEFWKDIQEEHGLTFETGNSAMIHKNGKGIFLKIEFEYDEVDDDDDD